MSTSWSEILAWCEAGLEAGATHMIVVCDTFEWEDYPVYVKPGENPRDKAKEFDGVNMQKIMEVYALWKGVPEWSSGRTHDYEMPTKDDPEVLARWSDAKKKWIALSLEKEGQKVAELRAELTAPELTSEQRIQGTLERVLAEVRSWDQPEPIRAGELNGQLRSMINQGVTIKEFPLLGEAIDAVLSIGFGIPDDIKEVFRDGTTGG